MGKAKIEQCHCEPVRRLVWYPKGISFGHNPPDFQTSTIENPGFYSYPGDCHTSDIGHWFAMTSFFERFDPYGAILQQPHEKVSFSGSAGGRGCGRPGR